ncbi:Ger(x)C family spore germination protein [Paenibacillus sp. N3/727]|uniref:Ger(x)C family spore germination protein n=1 Tax=Paenibacillus sp. N3/727 TaxID=2925845 RepID=UPI001F53E131|nr:Ger(x)C family spore germination protein [Paenibacillus sp. N3/727]UNK20978.1 Ger(x)C family spore germination protein [Paenibacillus sp. N3/727]
MRVYLRLIKITVALLLLNLLSGCWDIKEIQDVNYITALGIDYEDGNFIIYTQMLDFSYVAKAETGKSDKPAQVWTGKTTGKTLNMAISQVFNSAQERTVWSHISCIIMSENYLKTDIVKNTDTLNRYQEVRWTPWVFGTKESIERLLTTTAFFNLSPLKTLLHEPLQEYKQKSYIVPVRYFDFVAQLTEPATTALLPNLTIDSSTWKLNKKNDPKLIIDGAYALSSEGKYNGLLKNNELSGLRWLQEETRRSSINVKKDGVHAAFVYLEDPKIRRSLKMVHGVPRYQVHIESRANVTEALTEITETEIEKLAAEVIKQEILDTYNNGLKIKSDVYSLEHLLFKQKTGIWKQLQQSSDDLLDENSLDFVTVKVNIEFVGMMKLPKKP